MKIDAEKLVMVLRSEVAACVQSSENPRNGASQNQFFICSIVLASLADHIEKEFGLKQQGVPHPKQIGDFQ